MPDDQSEIGELDFAGEMHNLASEAQALSQGTGPRLDKKELMLSLGQMVRPLALELENIKRATAENAVLLTILGKAARAAQAEQPAIEKVAQQLQRLSVVESANQKLFDALHTELKGYKDGFLFDALQRPFIRDLVSIFDDFSDLHHQVAKRLAEVNAHNTGSSSASSGSGNGSGSRGPLNGPATKGGKAAAAANSSSAASARPEPGTGQTQTETEFLATLAGNLDNQVHHIMEVFLRLEVILSRSEPGADLDKKSHRTVSVEPAASAAEADKVVRSLKPGFTWRERSVRPEEVVVSRWNGSAPADKAASSDGAASNDDDGAEAKASTDNRRPSADGKLSKLR